MNYNTIIFVPHARAPFRKLSISSRLLGFGASAAAGILRSPPSRSDGPTSPRSAATASTARASRRTRGCGRPRADEPAARGPLPAARGLRDAGREASRSSPGSPSRPAAAREGPWRLPRRRSRSRTASLDTRLAEIATSSPGATDDLLHAHRRARARRHELGLREPPRSLQRIARVPQRPGHIHRSAEPVLATADGLVTRSGWSGDYGQMVEIAHRTGYRTVYGHLASVLVREGTRVKRGDRVGLAGSTGRSTGTHLHYEVRRGDRPVNPLEFILDALAGSLGPRPAGRSLRARSPAPTPFRRE